MLRRSCVCSSLAPVTGKSPYGYQVAVLSGPFVSSKVPSSWSRSIITAAPLQPATYTSLEILENELELINDATKDHIPVDADRLMRLLQASTELKNLDLIHKTRKVIQTLRPNHGALHNTLISAYAEVEQPQYALEIFRQMQDSKARDMRPRKTSHTALMKAFINEPAKARQIIHMIKEEKMKPNLVVFNTMINAYVKAGQLQEAEEVLVYMKSRNVFPDAYSFTPLINAYLHRGDRDSALKFLNEMTGRNIKPTLVTQTVVLRAHAAHDPDAARALLRQLKEKGMTLDCVAYTTVIRGFSRAGRLEEAIELLRELENDKSVRVSAEAYAPVIDACMYRKTPEGIAQAVSFLEEMKKKDVPRQCGTYYSLIRGFIVNDKPEEATAMINEMAKDASFPSLQIYANLLTFLAQRRKKGHAVQAWRNLLKTELVLNDSVFDPMLRVARGEVMNQEGQTEGGEVDDELLKEVEKVKQKTEAERAKKISAEEAKENAKKEFLLRREKSKEKMISDAWERRIQAEVEEQQNNYKKWRAAFDKHIMEPLRQDEEQFELRKQYKERGMWPPPEPPKPKVNQRLIARRKMIEERNRKREARVLEWEKMRQDKMAKQDQEILGKLSKKDRALVIAAREEEAAAKAAAQRGKGDDWDEPDTPVVSTKKEKKEDDGPKGKKKKKKADESGPEKASGGAGGGAGGGGAGGGKKK